jgi:hypothetical protein
VSVQGVVQVARGMLELLVDPLAVTTQSRQPVLRRLARSERLGPDQRRPRGRDGLRLSAVDDAATAAPQQPPLGRPQRSQDEYGGGILVRLVTDQVAPVRRPQEETELELNEAEEVRRGAIRPGAPRSSAAAPS